MVVRDCRSSKASLTEIEFATESFLLLGRELGSGRRTAGAVEPVMKNAGILFSWDGEDGMR